jgi:hypothetical protein
MRITQPVAQVMLDAVEDDTHCTIHSHATTLDRHTRLQQSTDDALFELLESRQTHSDWHNISHHEVHLWHDLVDPTQLLQMTHIVRVVLSTDRVSERSNTTATHLDPLTQTTTLIVHENSSASDFKASFQDGTNQPSNTWHIHLPPSREVALALWKRARLGARHYGTQEQPVAPILYS